MVVWSFWVRRVRVGEQNVSVVGHQRDKKAGSNWDALVFTNVDECWSGAAQQNSQNKAVIRCLSQLSHDQSVQMLSQLIGW